jgi:diketogulonate reductase-like aldo/keto reductase
VGIEYFDIYYIHLPDPAIPVAETAKAFNELVEEGVIKNIGISNASIKTIKEYQKYLKYPIAVCQNQYNLIYRESSTSGVINFCKQQNIKFVAWRPLQIPIPAIGVKSLYKKSNFEILDKMAKKYNKTVAQIAIKWLIEQDNVHVIFNTRNIKHLDEILETNTFEMLQEDLDVLTKDFPDQKEVGLIPLV